jgi:hypothetical protein
MGVVHRDVKPANLLVDDDGHLWVTDFGLARLGDGVGLTATGDLLGTLRYMSPEQALAKHGLVDHRTDVYSLGATLYELLTLRPAVGGDDKQEVLRRIAFEEPTPPRKLDKAIPPELETVTLKALAKDPAERYATAAELADDLRRFLADRPIRARRPTLPERTARWVRRHTAAVLAALAVALLAAVGATVGTALVWRANRDKDAALHDATAALAVADERTRFARATVDEMYTRVAEEWLKGTPRLQPLQRDFLERALAFYRDLAGQPAADPAVRWEVVRAYHRVGNIQTALGRHAEAEAAFREALRWAAEADPAAAASPACREDLAGIHAHLAGALMQTNRAADALALCDQAIKLHAGLVADYPDRAEYRFYLSFSQYNRGVALEKLERYPDADRAYREALATREAVLATAPDKPEYRHAVAQCHSSLGIILHRTGKPKEAEQPLRQAILHLEPLVAAFPARVTYREDLAHCLVNLTDAVGAHGRLDDCLDICRRAARLLDGLVSDYPDLPFNRELAAGNQVNLGIILRGKKQFEDARDAYRAADAAYQALVARFPDVPTYRHGRASVQNSLGLLLYRDLKQYPEAAAAWRLALDLRRQLAAESPGSQAYRDDVFRSSVRLAGLLANCPDAAVRDPARAVEAAARATELLPDNGEGWRYLGWAQYRAGQYDAAVRSLETANRRLMGGTAYEWYFLAMAHWRLGRPDQARDWYARAVRWADANGRDSTDLPNYRAEAAALLGLRTAGGAGSPAPPGAEHEN